MDEPSSFQNSCSVISVGSGGNTLEAWCNQSGGAANKTSILIPGIANNNGVLVYEQISSPQRRPAAALSKPTGVVSTETNALA
jgi:hypothetical protein